jgi:hypothetical protein
MKLKFNKAGTNLNWMQFSWAKALKVDELTRHGINVYPIPANKYLNIDFGDFKNPSEIQLLSLDGKKLMNINEKVTDVSGLKKGIYILKIRSESNVFTKKIVIN